MRYKISLLILSLLLFKGAFSQAVFMPEDDDYFHIVKRLEILGKKNNPYFHSSWRPIDRRQITIAVDSFRLKGYPLSTIDEFNFDYIRIDNPEFTQSVRVKSEKPLFKYFYEYKNSIYTVRNPDFDLVVSPVLYLSQGREFTTNSGIWTNTRGASVRGIIGKKVAFYTLLTENQILAPDYVGDYARATASFPGMGLTKNYRKLPNGYDFFEARGGIVISPIKQIQISFGQDRNFIGNGIRSLQLSNFTREYPYLKVQTKVWKFQYTNLFANLSPGKANLGERDLRRKYMAMHHLSINIGDKFNIGLFENIIFTRGDSLYGGGNFEWAYLNPVIFYRAVEHNAMASADNAMIGADFKWTPSRYINVYGQMVIDEFLISQLTARNGSWVNKYGIQAGLNYINVLWVRNLDLQLEYNTVRPYTYSHYQFGRDYSHNGQPLAHPWGANFREFIAIIRYQPMERVKMSLRTIYGEFGTDTAGRNFGSDISKNYRTRFQDLNNKIGQGELNKLWYNDFTVTYMPFHNVFFDLSYIYRIQYRKEQTYSKEQMLVVSMRWNFGRRLWEF